MDIDDRMDFNPISLEESDALSRPRPAPVHGSSGGINGVPLNKVLKESLENYYLDLLFDINTACATDGENGGGSSLLLYSPPHYPSLFSDGRTGEAGGSDATAAAAVMGCEIDAMAEGIAESLPLAVPFLSPAAVRQAREAVRAAEEGGERPPLDAEDAQLLESDIDASVADTHALMHTLAQLQKPIYTEMSGDTARDRHFARLQRLSDASTAHAAGEDAVEGETEVMKLQKKRETFNVNVMRTFKSAKFLDVQFAQFLTEFTKQKLGLPHGESGESSDLAFAERLWESFFFLRINGTNVVFPFTDGAKHRCWQHLCHFSFNYKVESHAAMSSALADNIRKTLSPPDKRRERTSFFDAGGRHGGRSAGPTHTEEERSYIERFGAILDEYASCVERFIVGTDGDAKAREELRLQSLSFNPTTELDLLYRSDVFAPDLHGSLSRPHSSRGGTGGGSAAVQAYPVSVSPVFPSAFRALGDAGVIKKVLSGAGAEDLEEQMDRLGEDLCDNICHLRIPQARLDAEKNTFCNHTNKRTGVTGKKQTISNNTNNGPHVMVNDTNFLTADVSLYNGSGSGETMSLRSFFTPQHAEQDGTSGFFSVGYTSTDRNTFDLLFRDDENTGSYVFRTFPNASTSRGHTGPSGTGYVVYDRIGTQNVYVKKAKSEADTNGNFLLLFDSATESVGDEQWNENGKRARVE